MLGRAIRRIERLFIYAPELTLKGTPAHVGLEYEDVWLTPDGDEKIHGWWIPGPASRLNRRPTWVYFHGNGGNISARLDGYLQMHRRLGANILAIDYRGYGLSEGVPSEDATYSDGLAAFDYAAGRNDAQDEGPGQIFLLGVSMGAAIAARVALDRPADAVVLESAPPSFPELAALHQPWTRALPIRLIMRTRYATSMHVSKLKAPSLFFHGELDEIVPLKYGRRVFDAALDPRELWVIEGAGHERLDLVDEDLYYGRIASFIREHASPAAAAGAPLKKAI